MEKINSHKFMHLLINKINNYNKIILLIMEKIRLEKSISSIIILFI